ncbi:uncharacterized protein LOC127264365 [Andrographis paniculata]|uniref:uncharacterized protein LOC127264365 n=1 Tax=Andrographis paniculata TaxID=175694 RepID=UPI0021E778C2|nr:uncharacterized protein LOC127264365 [Andrographis paniculata]
MTSRRDKCGSIPPISSTFFPLCLLSFKAKDILPRCRSHPIAAEPEPEPDSPRVTCIGQVKRTTTRVIAHSHSHNNFKYDHSKVLKFKRFFSDSRRVKNGGGGLKEMDIGELDPPLPVVKRAAPADAIWKRRSISGKTPPEIQLPARV